MGPCSRPRRGRSPRGRGRARSRRGGGWSTRGRGRCWSRGRWAPLKARAAPQELVEPRHGLGAGPGCPGRPRPHGLARDPARGPQERERGSHGAGQGDRRQRVSLHPVAGVDQLHQRARRIPACGIDLGGRKGRRRSGRTAAPWGGQPPRRKVQAPPVQAGGIIAPRCPLPRRQPRGSRSVRRGRRVDAAADESALGCEDGGEVGHGLIVAGCRGEIQPSRRVLRRPIIASSG